jgi:hypothetical protein
MGRESSSIILFGLRETSSVPVRIVFGESQGADRVTFHYQHSQLMVFVLPVLNWNSAA